jgi:primosomal protein N'
MVETNRKEFKSGRNVLFISKNTDTPIVILGDRIRYMVYQKETIEEVSVYRGYAEFKDKTTVKQFRESIGDINAMCYVSSKEDIDCCDEDNRIGDLIIFGEPSKTGRPKKQKDVDDQKKILEWIDEKVKEGWTDLDFYKYDKSISLNYKRAIEHARTMSVMEKDQEREKRRRDHLAKFWNSLNPLQQLVVDRVSRQNDRQVTWVVDVKGSSGKSVLAECLQFFDGWETVNNSSTKDILRYLSSYKEKKGTLPTGIIFDYMRSQRGETDSGKEKDFVNYQVLEIIKNCQGLSTKYEPIKILLETGTKVLIMANFYPDTNKLTANRWDIIEWTTIDGPGKDYLIPILDSSC